MKKLKLNLQQIDSAEVLTRSQLKKVLGGLSGSNTCPTGEVPCTCTSDSGSFSGCVSSVADCWNKC